MVLLKARCNHKVWLCLFKVGLASLTQVDLPPWYGLEVRWLEITVQTDTTQFTTSKSLTTIELQHCCRFWTLTPMSIRLSKEDFNHCPFGHREILRPIPVFPTYVNFHLGWKAERGHWSLVSLSSSLWLSLFLFSLPLSLSFFPFCSATEQQKRWKA